MRLVLLTIVVLLSLATVDSGNNSPAPKVRNVPHSLAGNSTHSSRRSRANVPVVPQLKATGEQQPQVKQEEEVRAAGRDKRGKYTLHDHFLIPVKSSDADSGRKTMPRSSVFDIALRQISAEVATIR